MVALVVELVVGIKALYCYTGVKYTYLPHLSDNLRKLLSVSASAEVAVWEYTDALLIPKNLHCRYGLEAL